MRRWHRHVCEICHHRFVTPSNLAAHREREHGRYECRLCLDSISDHRILDGDHDDDTGDDYRFVALAGGQQQQQQDPRRDYTLGGLIDHVFRIHDRRIRSCARCQNKIFYGDADYERHHTMVHTKQCSYCGEKLASAAQVRQHIAVHHGAYSCHFCGALFDSEAALYRHQRQHCRERFKCPTCDREFETLVQCNTHMSTHVSRIGACSVHRQPSQTRHVMAWNALVHRDRPWEDDAHRILGYGRVQERINRRYMELRGERAPGTAITRGDDNLRARAVDEVVTSYRARIRDVYERSGTEYVNHTSINPRDGSIERVNVALLEKGNFLDQLESSLREIFDAVRGQIPYKLVIVFGFLLYQLETDDFSTFFVVQHLSRNPSDKALVNQMPNLWIIRNPSDEDGVIDDIRQTEFFDLVRDHFQANYNFLIVRMTHMVVEIFPMDYCPIQERVLLRGGHDLIGRGLDDGSVSEKDGYSSEERRYNPASEYINFEAIDDDDDEGAESVDENDGVEGDSSEHSIECYIQSLQQGRYQTLIGLRKRITRQATYESLCFFAQVAWWHLKATEPGFDNVRLKTVTTNYYDVYRKHYNIGDDEMFRGVHVATMPYMEYLFKTRINVYEITRLERTWNTTSRGTTADRLVPVLRPLYLTAGCHVYTNMYHTLNLLLFKGHYYTIRDMKFLTTPRGYSCPSCGHDFASRKVSNIRRHMTHHCNKRRYKYKTGCVESRENVWTEARRLFSFSTDLLQEYTDCFTKEFVTFDFEARISRQRIDEFTSDSMDESVAYEDDGSTCTQAEFLRRRSDDSCILVNIPLSFALATNIPCEILEETDGVWIGYRCCSTPEELIDEFVTILVALASTRRRQMMERYFNEIFHIQQWFAEKGLSVDVTSLDQTVTPLLDDMSDDEPRRNMDTLRREIALVKRLQRFMTVLPVLGFNSGAYDIPLMKQWLFPRLLRVVGGDVSRIDFVKKSVNRYASVLVRGCDIGLSFLDIMQYLPPGFNLDNFVRSFASEETRNRVGDKSYFPYEYVDTFERLSERQLPPYEAFYSRLRRTNILDSDYRRHIARGGLGHDAPPTGQEVYSALLDLWTRRGWTTVGDYLRYYNLQDVIPFLEAVIVYSRQLQSRGVDMVRDAISLPGLAKHILLSHVPPRTLHYIDNPFVYNKIRRNEVGGQSIIFTRRNDAAHPYVKGYDANSLYLYCLGEPQFVGSPVIYKEMVGLSTMLRRDDEARAKSSGLRRVFGRDSKMAESYLSYMEQVELAPRRLVLYRQYCIRLTRGERSVLLRKYAERGIPESLVPYRIVVDGYYEDDEDDERSIVSLDTRCRHVVEFDGCYWHGCERCSLSVHRVTRAGDVINREQTAYMTVCRHDTLRQRGFVLHVMRECDWSVDPRRREVPADYLVDPLVVDSGRSYITTKDRIIEKLRAGSVHGVVVCDLRVPDTLKESFKDFAPIIKHAVSNHEDIGAYMQAGCDERGYVVKDRRCVIDSYIGVNIGLIDEYVLWLLDKGIVIDRIRAFIRYEKHPIFGEFVDDITRMRLRGDADPTGSSGVRALTAKLIGNSAFGSCITNKYRHRDVALYAFDDVCRGGPSSVTSLSSVVRYERLTPSLLEVEKLRRDVTYDQLRLIGKCIFDRAKLSVLRFYYDFLKRVLRPGSYQLLETDTDSIYVSLQYEKFEDNVADMSLYEELRDQFMVSERDRFGVRQPNRYKLECEGSLMVSLCSKSYCVYDDATRRSKFSCKGIQKSNFELIHEECGRSAEVLGQTISRMYDEALADDAANHRAVNRGLKRRRGQMILDEQTKILFNSLYVKHRVLSDGVSTVPLDI